MSPNEPLSYAAAGVDTEAGDQAVELMRAAVSASHGPQVVGGVGGFAGLFDASELKSYERPLLVSSTDGVGTKVAIAQALGIHDTIGQDLVAMVVDDIVVTGARPLTMTDYIACGKVYPERIAAIVTGIARACAATGTALVGGETAEHPGLMGPEDYDVAGAAVGVVEEAALLGPQRVRAGDVLLGIESSGLHSNGFSLVRAIVDRAGWSLDREVPEFGRSLGEELLEPTRLYTRACLALASAPNVTVRAFSHITGGGLAANVARVLPVGLRGVVQRSAWDTPPVFRVLAQLGQVSRADCERTWNLGIGMVAVVAAGTEDEALRCLAGQGMAAHVIGQIVSAPGTADRDDIVTGTKGVAGGQVVVVD